MFVSEWEECLVLVVMKRAGETRKEEVEIEERVEKRG
jgi:hypothetical protein